MTDDISARETLAQAFEQAEEVTEPTAEPVADQPVATDTTPDTPLSEPVETPEQKAERERDELGRFKAKEGAEDPGPDDTAAVHGETEADEGAESDDFDEPEALDPPDHWSLEDQEMFRKQAADVQNWMLNREREIARRQSEAGEARKRYAYMDEIMTPDRVRGLQVIGQTPDQFMGQLIALSDYAASDKPGFARWFATQHGLQATDIFPDAVPQTDETPDQEFADPRVTALEQQLAEATQRIDQFTGHFQQQQAGQQTAQESEASRIIEDFRNATDDKGKPAHPYFAEVQESVAALLSAGQADTLDAAYDMAVHANPKTRAKMEAARKATAEREAERERRQKAKDARRAGSSIAGSPAGVTTPAPPANARDHLAQLAREGGFVS